MDIFEEAKKVDWNNTESAIEYYESHKLFFQNDQHFNDDHTNRDLASMNLMYGNALLKRSHYKKALPVVEQTKSLLERLSKDFIGYEHLFEKVLFLEARTLHGLKKYFQSVKIFKELTEMDSENYSYRNWYFSSIVQISDSTLIAVCIIAAIFFALDIYTAIHAMNSVNFNLFGVSIIIVSLTIHHSLKYLLKKKLKL
ncbi:hypothetical protein [Rhodohalobacter sp. 8-1]|uniref:hypothetical protein n=1 Tax=Rhodohalobacter sp. 8-1 TaxID=3131972 RepID=UPI0030EF8F56